MGPIHESHLTLSSPSSQIHTPSYGLTVIATDGFVNTAAYGFAVAIVRTPRQAWIDAALAMFAVGGSEAVRVETLATQLGVTKGGFYWHFADRQALLNAMIEAWEVANTHDLIAQVENTPGDPRSRLQQLFQLTQHAVLPDVEIAIREWARRDPAIAKSLRRIDNRRMDYLRSLFEPICSDEQDVEERCMLAFALVIGNHFITAQHGKRSRAEVMQSAVERLVGSKLGTEFANRSRAAVTEGKAKSARVKSKRKTS